MKACIQIDMSAAIKAGKNISGKQFIDFDPAGLSEEEREEAASHLEIGHVVNINDNISVDGKTVMTIPDVTEANLEEFKRILGLRIQARKQAEIDLVFSESVKKDEEKAKRFEEATEENNRRTRILEWLKENETPNQKERIAAGYFDFQEAIDGIENEEFFGLDDIPVFKPITGSDVCTCPDQCYVSSSVVKGCPLSAKEFDTFKKIRNVYGVMALTIPRMHVGVGVICGAKVFRLGFLVTKSVDGFEFKREYGFEDEVILELSE